MQGLAKENDLLKEYIKNLEMQLHAYAQQHQGLCKQMNTINHQNLQLNRRISEQPTHQASQAALQHYQESLKSERFKNLTLSKELSIARKRIEELANNCAKQKRITQELEAERQKLKEEKNKIQRQKQQFQKTLSDICGKMIKMNQENMALIEQKTLLLKEKQIFNDQIKQQTQQIQNLQQENAILSQSLNQARSQVQELSAQIKQYVNNKVHQKCRKNRTYNCHEKTHFEFDNAFRQLRVQIEAIKQDHLDTPSSKVQDSTLPFKQNAGMEISSPSKWKSIEGKLSLLRSTKSMIRFR